MGDVITMDGHVLPSPDQQERYLRFMREEGLPLLDLFRQIDDRTIRAAFGEMIKRVAIVYSGRP